MGLLGLQVQTAKLNAVLCEAHKLVVHYYYLLTLNLFFPGICFVPLLCEIFILAIIQYILKGTVNTAGYHRLYSHIERKSAMARSFKFRARPFLMVSPRSIAAQILETLFEHRQRDERRHQFCLGQN